MTSTARAALAWLAVTLAPLAAAAAPSPKADLPDWSGTWQLLAPGAFVFDTASQTRLEGGGLREHPPYRPEWEARYLKNIAGVADGTFPDPLTYCGIPAGFPRMLNVPDGHEWIVTPKQVWHTAENATGLRRIYTDGRKHPAHPGHTLYGHAIGHWEGDTLVVDTVGMRRDSILDRTGAVLSDERHVVERIRKIDDVTLEDQITIEDPVALTMPWTVVKRFRRQPKGTYVFDYACAENNRNPVDDKGRTITLDQNGKPLHD